MGEAKRRRQEQARLIYHHTSILRTSELWMKGRILPEGKMPLALHPKLGEIRTDATFRRAMKDFPPLVWLTRRIDVPKVLLNTGLSFVSKSTGEEVLSQQAAEELSNAIALNRVALGFRIDDVQAQPWPTHPGYTTGEGEELNATAREAGDDPTDWWVSEVPIDIMSAVEVRLSRSKYKPKLERNEEYLGHVKQMVARCRADPTVCILPSWLTEEQAQLVAKKVGVSILPGNEA